MATCEGAGYVIHTNPDTVRAPDVGFLRRERLPVGDIPTDFFAGAPDLAVEVISPRDRLSDVLEKTKEYLAAGTQCVWVIHPRERTVTIYQHNTASPVIIGESDILRGEPVIPGFRVPVSEIFQRGY
jgi:Uma2 family endonuclease